MTEREKRKIERLAKNIQETETLLDEWEEQKRLASNPTEKKRSEIEIERLQKILQGYEDELKELKNTAEQLPEDNSVEMLIENKQQLKQVIEKLLQKNQISTSLILIRQFADNQRDNNLKVWANTQLGRLSQVENDYGEAIITYEQYNSELSRIRKAILGKV